MLLLSDTIDSQAYAASRDFVLMVLILSLYLERHEERHKVIVTICLGSNLDSQIVTD